MPVARASPLPPPPRLRLTGLAESARRSWRRRGGQRRTLRRHTGCRGLQALWSTLLALHQPRMVREGGTPRAKPAPGSVPTLNQFLEPLLSWNYTYFLLDIKIT